MQWNVMYSEDVGQVADFIKQSKPDIVCLQELTESYQDRGDTAEMISEHLGYNSHYAYGPMIFPDGSQGRMGKWHLHTLCKSNTHVTLPPLERL
jgi:endonuclease/exonuclease/phosphatase family metal-dependent hydrolase